MGAYFSLQNAPKPFGARLCPDLLGKPQHSPASSDGFKGWAPEKEKVGLRTSFAVAGP